jgi:hypothetical protein
MNVFNPLAQTFAVDAKGGIFATSLAIYFSEKDDTEPVTVQLRTVLNGVPTAQIIPFSEVTVESAAVLTSADSSLPTNFTFQAPVFLQQAVEYAFVVQSNSDKYALWVSEIGGVDSLTPSYTITKQPSSGVLFKSSNGTTWSPDQTKDIKFVLRRAAFAESGTAVFTEASIPPVSLDSDPLYTTSGSKIIRVYHPNHGHFAGSSQVTISGITSVGVNGIPAAEVNTTFTVLSVEQDWYTIQVSTTNATSTGRSGGTDVTATENRPFDVVSPLVTQIVTPDVTADWTARMTTGASLAGTEQPHVVEDYVPLKVNDNNYLKRPHVIVSDPNRTLLTSGDRSFTLNSDFSTYRNNLSPAIDLARLSVATIANRIDNPSATLQSGYNQVANYVPETASHFSSALSKYITKKIDLNDPASAISVYVSVNRPTGSDLLLYYKVQPKGSDTNFDDTGWSLASPASTIPVTDDPNNYTEIQYSIDETMLGNVQFSSFAIKLVFVSENSSAVATCKNFRAIAVT